MLMSSPFHLPVFFLACWMTLAVAAGAHGQSLAQDRVSMDQTLREAARISGQTEALSLSAQTDEDSRLLEKEYGTQRIRPLPPESRDWLLTLEAGGFYTSNALLAPFAESQDWVGRSVLRMAWAPAITDQLSVMVAVNYGLWRYSDLPFLDFDDVGAQAGLVWTSDAPPLAGGMERASAWAQYRYNRLLQPWEWDAFLYETHFAEAGLRRAWGIGQDVAVWGAGNAAVSVAGRPALFRRSEYSTQLGALWQITPNVTATMLYRAALFDYLEDARQDVNQLIHVGVSWQIRPSLRAEVYLGGSFNDSDLPVFDYQALNLGLNFAISKMW